MILCLSRSQITSMDIRSEEAAECRSLVAPGCRSGAAWQPVESPADSQCDMTKTTRFAFNSQANVSKCLQKWAYMVHLALSSNSSSTSGLREAKPGLWE